MMLDSEWKTGRVSLIGDSLYWESSGWPDQQAVPAFCLERNMRRRLTVKIAGPARDRYLMRALNVVAIRALREIADDERDVLLTKRAGMLPSGSGAADKLAWISCGQVD